MFFYNMGATHKFHCSANTNFTKLSYTHIYNRCHGISTYVMSTSRGFRLGIGTDTRFWYWCGCIPNKNPDIRALITTRYTGLQLHSRCRSSWDLLVWIKEFAATMVSHQTEYGTAAGLQAKHHRSHATVTRKSASSSPAVHCCSGSDWRQRRQPVVWGISTPN